MLHHGLICSSGVLIAELALARTHNGAATFWIARSCNVKQYYDCQIGAYFFVLSGTFFTYVPPRKSVENHANRIS